MEQIIDTRDLIERREELKDLIFSDFVETFPQYEEMTETYEDIRMEEEEIQNWKEGFADEIEEINDIDLIENVTGEEFNHGEMLIREDYFVEYVEDMLVDCGYISKNFPTWIEIDWEATADNVKADYTEVVYLGETYLVRLH